MNKNMSDNETLICDNYFTLGVVGCSKKFNLSLNQVRYIVRKFNLKWNNDLRFKNNANLELFDDINRPDIAYFIGLIFADGSLRKKSINIEFSKKDYESIKELFSIVGKWSIRTRQREKWKEQAVLTMNSVKLSNIFKDKKFKGNDFSCLTFINKSMWPFFFRGLSDGDGCWSGKRSLFSISSCYDFNWDMMKSLLLELNIKFSHYKTITKKGHKYSTVKIDSLDGSIKWGKYIYQNMTEFNICFPRKFIKFLDCVNYNINYLNKINEEGFYKEKGIGFIRFNRKDCKFSKYGIKTIEEAILTREKILREKYPNLLYKYLYSDIIDKEINFLLKMKSLNFNYS